MLSSLMKVATSYRKPVLPADPLPAAEKVSTRGETEGMARGIIRKAGVPIAYREEMVEPVVDAILFGRQQKIRNKDSDLFNTLAGHTCVKDWVKKAFETYENDTRELDAEMKDVKRKTLIQGISILLGEGFNILQEPNPSKKQFFERDSDGKIIGILNTAEGQPNARFSECDKAIRSGEKLLEGGKRRKTRRTRRKSKKTLRRKLN
jgi:hypothetical protein